MPPGSRITSTLRGLHPECQPDRKCVLDWCERVCSPPQPTHHHERHSYRRDSTVSKSPIDKLTRSLAKFPQNPCFSPFRRECRGRASRHNPPSNHRLISSGADGGASQHGMELRFVGRTSPIPARSASPDWFPFPRVTLQGTAASGQECVAAGVSALARAHPVLPFAVHAGGARINPELTNGSRAPPRAIRGG